MPWLHHDRCRVRVVTETGRSERPRPSGTVSFLFTDIEGSTNLWERAPQAMRASLSRHDALVGEAIDQHGGYVFSSGGDGFGVAFQRASDAVAASVAMQRAMQSEPWSHEAGIAIRAGIHTGEADERGGDYFGQPVNRAARVMSAARGGQILVSGITAQLLGGDHSVELVDFGTRRLKGVADQVPVFGVRAEGLAWVDRPLDTDQNVPGNLTRYATEYVGRIDVLRRQAESLNDRRLVTLTGTGGVGKSRTAIEVGWLSLEKFPGGVWMIELAAVSDPTAVVASIAATLGVQAQPGMTLTEAIVDWMRRRRMLLIIDNCEHVLNEVADFVVDVLAQCPSVTVVATSREPLGVVGERVVPVASLALADAEELFRLRALAADGSLTFSADDERAISAICERLDGIPLAVELAACRVRSLSLTDLQARLNDRFRLLRGGGRGALERHQTLRAAVTWSHQLLTQNEKTVFDRLSVFGGGFDATAAEAVCADNGSAEAGVDADDVVDLVSSLVDKSMVVADRSSGATRYRLLESLRQYGEERLQESDDFLAIRDRHFRHYLTRAQAARSLQMGRRSAEGNEFFEREWDNLRVAHEWTKANNDLDGTQALVRASFVYAWPFAIYEHESWTQQLLALGAAGFPLQTSTFLAAGTWAYLAFDDGLVFDQANRGIARDTDPSDVAICGWLATLSLLRFGRIVDAAAALHDAEPMALMSGDPYAKFWLLYGFAQLAISESQEPGGPAAVALRDFVAEAGALWMVAWAGHSAAVELNGFGDYRGALAQARVALDASISAGWWALEGLAALEIVYATLAPAAAALTPECRELIERLLEANHWIGFWGCVDAVANFTATHGNIDAAATLLGYLDAFVPPFSGAFQKMRGATSAMVREQPESLEAYRHGSAMSRDELCDYVMTLIPPDSNDPLV